MQLFRRQQRTIAPAATLVQAVEHMRRTLRGTAIVAVISSDVVDVETGAKKLRLTLTGETVRVLGYDKLHPNRLMSGHYTALSGWAVTERYASKETHRTMQNALPR